MRWLVLLLSIIAALCGPPFGRAQTPEDAARQQEEANARARRAIERKLRDYADRMFDFKDPAKRVRGPARMAEQLCKADLLFSLELFSRAYSEALSAEKVLASDPAHVSPGQLSDLNGAREELLTLLTKCDPGLGHSIAASDAAARVAQPPLPAPPPDPNPPVNDDIGTATDDSIDNIERPPDEISREVNYARLIARRLSQDEFGPARDAMARIRDGAVGSVFAQVIDYSEATYLLEKTRTSEALALMKGLRPGIERALLNMQIALATAKYDRRLAAGALFAALKDVREVDDDRQPYLLLAAAGVHARIDPRGGLTTLLTAVKAIVNDHQEQQAERELRQSALPAQPTRSLKRMPRTGVFVEVVSIGDHHQILPLHAPGVYAYNLTGVLGPFIAEEFDPTERILLQNGDEEILLQSIPFLASGFIRQLETLNSKSNPKD